MVTIRVKIQFMPMCINYFIGFLIVSSVTYGLTCNKQKINSIETGVSLPHHMFDRLYPGGLMLCARECKYRPRCKSFNYIESNGECQLNDDTMSGTVQNRSGVVYGDINNWSETILANCAQSFCSQLQKCEPNEYSYSCGSAYENVTNANHTAFLGHTFDVVTANTEDDCVQECMLRYACLSFNYKSDSNTCELNDEVMITDYQSYIGNQPNSYYSNINLYDMAILGACASHNCDQYSKCEVNGGSYTCVILYCPTPTAPYADVHVIPEFDLNLKLWSVGNNLSYSCWTSYYPNTDWTCLNNGTWLIPTCKALRKCRDLFEKCNPSYNNGIYVFKFPGTEYDVVVECFYGKTFPYLRILQNTSYSYFSTKYDQICQSNTHQCGLRIFTAIKVYVFATEMVNVDDLDFSTTDCDGPYMFTAGKNCDLNCNVSNEGSFHADIRGTGVRYTNDLTITKGSIQYSNGDQVVHGLCNDCAGPCVVSQLVLLPSSNEINYEGAIFPSCIPRT